MRNITKLLVIIFLLCTIVCGLWTTSYAEIPKLINYQGRLTDSQGQPITGTKAVSFRIYETESGGSPLWQETHTTTLDRGIFNVFIGGVTPLNLPFDKQYYLGIQVGSDPEMSPRQRLASVGYAFRAEHGVPKGVIVMWSGRIADIPSGWALCDGTNGTPDLRDRFIVAAKQDDGGVAKTNISSALTQSGGSITISEANLPSHSHAAGTLATASGGAHTHYVEGGQYQGGVYRLQDIPLSLGIIGLFLRQGLIPILFQVRLEQQDQARHIFRRIMP